MDVGARSRSGLWVGLLLCALLWAAAGCELRRSGLAEPDSGTARIDAGPPRMDAGMDGGQIDPDAGIDSGTDAGTDACAPVEDCNEVDDDCDGVVDEGLASQACGMGACVGTRRCEMGEWTDCDGREPVLEGCNDVDDDCDGVIDEEVAPQPCGMGECAGMQACEGAGVWGACDGAMPGTEACDGALDEDCDGMVDEGCCTDGETRPCGGLGICEGVETCVGTMWSGVCAGMGTATMETCNTLDDNCDGSIDEAGACGGCVHHEFGGHTYQICATNLEWPNARDVCRGVGYQLATINDMSEQDSLAPLIAAAGQEHWIGYNDRRDEGTWVWSGAAGSGYENWGSGEPNDNGLGGEDCAVMRASDGRWNDLYCGDWGDAPDRPFICEYGP